MLGARFACKCARRMRAHTQTLYGVVSATQAHRTTIIIMAAQLLSDYGELKSCKTRLRRFNLTARARATMKTQQSTTLALVAARIAHLVNNAAAHTRLIAIYQIPIWLTRYFKCSICARARTACVTNEASRQQNEQPNENTFLQAHTNCFRTKCARAGMQRSAFERSPACARQRSQTESN